MGKRNRTVSDFPVDTNGHCFLCLNKVLPEYKPNKSGSVSTKPYSSLHSLSQYLKMDMSKVFHEKESIPSDLLNSVQSSRLKVSLCEQCTGWNDKIANLCRKLEKIEIEVNFYVELIQGSLLGSNEDDQTGMRCKFGDDHGLLEKVRIIKALRTEAKQRCSQKLKSVHPRVNLQNLTSSQVFLMEQRIKSKSRKDVTSNQPDLLRERTSFCDADNVKNEGLGFVPDRNDNFQDDDDDAVEGTISEDENDSNNSVDHPRPTESSLSVTQTVHVAKKKKNINTNATTSSKKVPPNSSIKAVEKLTFVINPETSKFKCNICSGEFTQRVTLKRHYDGVHLKIKHRCNLCGKEFTQMSDLDRHHKSAHVGVRFKCNLCGKCFTLKDSLIRHQRAAHMGT